MLFPIIFPVIFSIVSTCVIIPTLKGLPGQHYSDFQPDYPGGVLALTWLAANVAIWMMWFHKF